MRQILKSIVPVSANFCIVLACYCVVHLIAHIMYHFIYARTDAHACLPNNISFTAFTVICIIVCIKT
jgi:hypothetical protein